MSSKHWLIVKNWLFQKKVGFATVSAARQLTFNTLKITGSEMGSVNLGLG